MDAFRQNLGLLRTYRGWSVRVLAEKADISENTTIASTDIEIDDIILEVNGIKITQNYVLNAMLNSLVDFQVGDEITIKYFDRSSNEIKTTNVVLMA